MFSIIKIIHDVSNKNIEIINVIWMIISFIILGLIFYYVYWKKRLIIDTFDILKTLVENNKLQTLREVVMVVNRKYEKTKNMCNIENAVFRYTLEPNGSSSYFDVHYEISLTINKCNKKNSHVKFYAILDTIGKNYIKDIPVLITIKWDNSQLPVVFETLPRSVTISGLDNISYYSGLYEISFLIPKQCLQSIKTMPIECNISYCIRDNVYLKNENGYQEYNFAIVPANYGKHVKMCNVEVIVPKALSINVACQSVCTNEEAEKMLDLVQVDSGNSVQKCYRLPEIFKPKMDGVYFIHLTTLQRKTDDEGKFKRIKRIAAAFWNR